MISVMYAMYVVVSCRVWLRDERASRSRMAIAAAECSAVVLMTSDDVPSLMLRALRVLRVLMHVAADE